MLEFRLEFRLGLPDFRELLPGALELAMESSLVALQGREGLGIVGERLEGEGLARWLVDLAEGLLDLRQEDVHFRVEHGRFDGLRAEEFPLCGGEIIDQQRFDLVLGKPLVRIPAKAITDS